VALVAPGTTDWRTLPEVAGRPLFLALADGLVAFDPLTGLVKPGLAESWTVQNGGRDWSFVLRPKVRWSDGTPLTSRDFVEAWGSAGIRTVSLEAPDARRLTVSFPDPLPDVAVLAGPRFLLLPDRAQSRGCGPFVLVDSGPGRLLTLAKNPLFREAATIAFTALEFRFVDTVEEADSLFRGDLADWLPLGSGPGTAADTGLRNTVVSPGWGTVFLRLNLRAPGLASAEQRRALAASLDRVALSKGLRGAPLLPSATLVPSVVAPARPQAPASVGPTPGRRLIILHPVGETYRTIAASLAAQWRRALGLNVETKAASHDQVMQDRASGVYEVALSGWLGDYPDPTAFLEVFGSQAAANDTGFADPAFDALLDRIRTLPPGKERLAALQKAQVLLDSAAPAIALLCYASVNRINLSRWSGWSANPSDIHPWQGLKPRK